MAAENIEARNSEMTAKAEEQSGSLLSQALIMSGWLRKDTGHSDNTHLGALTQGAKPVFNDSSRPVHST